MSKASTTQSSKTTRAFGPARIVLSAAFAALAVFGLTACGSSAATPTVSVMGQGPSQDTGQPTSDAICNDLGPGGLSIFQLKKSVPEYAAMDGHEFAATLRANVSLGCPALLQDEGVKGFLSAQGVTP